MFLPGLFITTKNIFSGQKKYGSITSLKFFALIFYRLSFKTDYAGGIVDVAKAIYFSKDKIRFDTLPTTLITSIHKP